MLWEGSLIFINAVRKSKSILIKCPILLYKQLSERMTTSKRVMMIKTIIINWPADEEAAEWEDDHQYEGDDDHGGDDEQRQPVVVLPV